MFSKEEKYKLLKEEIVKKYFKNGVFKDFNLKDIAENNQYKLIKGVGEFIYGYDLNGIDYYFLFRSFNNEGFIWNRVSLKDKGGYKTIDTFIPTQAYSNDFFKLKASEFNLDKARDNFNYRFNINTLFNTINLDFKKTLALLNFSLFGVKYNKIKKIKVLGILLLSFTFNYKEDIFLEPSENILNLIELRKSTDSEPLAQESDINYIFALYLIENIDNILKKEINIFYLLNEFRKL